MRRLNGASLFFGVNKQAMDHWLQQNLSPPTSPVFKYGILWQYHALFLNRCGDFSSLCISFMT